MQLLLMRCWFCLCPVSQRNILNTHQICTFCIPRLRSSLAYLHLSAASLPSSFAIGGNGVCVLSSLVCIVQSRLLLASLTVGLNIIPIPEKSVMSRESSRGNAPVTIVTSVPWERERDITEVAKQKIQKKIQKVIKHERVHEMQWSYLLCYCVQTKAVPPLNQN